MKNSILYLYSNMDKSSQILLFLIILVALMLISIFVINSITKKKNEDINGLSKKSKLPVKNDIKPTIQMNKNKPKNNNSNLKVIEKKEPIKKQNIKEEIIEKIDETEKPRHAREENKIDSKEKNVEEVVNIKNKTSIDDIANLLENTKVNKPIDLTKFEEDQEENAIISYDELVKRAGAKKIVYKCEEKNEIIEEKPKEIEKIEDVKETKKFKASKVISPIFGIQKEVEEKDEVLESFIDLENFTNDKSSNKEDSDSEFLNNLKQFRSTLD